mmetsp:Transcript_34143/g.67197  ORF Transcript_34143/g.67197 Transcript_34143/m.67197 type:complete len:565 (+) Transcript_34143:100-1794(+)
MAKLNDGSLDIHISRDKSHGETTMMAFIKQHMGEILRPFAEHVDELHKSVDEITDNLATTDSKAKVAVERIDAHDKQIQVLRASLEKTNDLATKTQAGLEKKSAEQSVLEADHQETKQNLSKTHQRLLDTVAHLTKLQQELDETNSGLDKTKMGLNATKDHIAYKVDKQLAKHTDGLEKLDSSLNATKHLLKETKSFSEKSYDEFKGFVEATGKQDQRNKEQFARDGERLAHLSTMLTETINRLNTHANHLRTTNTAIRPLKEHFERISSAHYEMNKEQKGHGKHLGTLQVEVDAINRSLNEIKGAFSNGDQGLDLNEEVTRMKSSISDVNKTMHNMEDQLNSTVTLLPDHHKRIILLENSSQHHGDQLQHLHKTVGVEKKEVPPAPPLPTVTAQPVIMKQPEPLARRIVQEGPQIMRRKKFIDVVKEVSIKEKQQLYKDRLEDHERGLQDMNRNLAETNKELHEKMGLRVRMLEAQVHNTLVPTVEQLKAGMELTEEYWKGLSHGLRESHKMVAVDNELLQTPHRTPSARGQTLPALSKTPPMAGRTQDRLLSPRYPRGSSAR